MLTLDLPVFPVLTTERLVLRRLQSSDAERMFAMRSDPLVMQHVNRPMARTVEDASALIEMINGRITAGESLHWAITLPKDDVFMGLIDIWRLVKEHHYGELGYTLMQAHWGEGYASEAIAAVVDFGFDTLGLHRMEAITRPANLASMRVLEKKGFVREELLRQNILWKGVFHDSVLFGRVRG